MEITGLILIFSKKKNETKSFPFHVCREHDTHKTGQSRFNWNTYTVAHYGFYSADYTPCAYAPVFTRKDILCDVLYV